MTDHFCGAVLPPSVMVLLVSLRMKLLKLVEIVNSVNLYFCNRASETNEPCEFSEAH